MPEYRRLKLHGGSYFFTVVTYARKPIFNNPLARDFLHAAWVNTCERFPFITEAVCLLPDHIHCIWTLPENDANYSVRWKEIKRLFTREYAWQIDPGEERNDSRVRRGEAAIWQRRFWEHLLRDDSDFYNHVNYIHLNPVKHGLVQRVSEWPWSSFHRFVKMGHYEPDWEPAVGAFKIDGVE